jgi:hypothetical protein
MIVPRYLLAVLIFYMPSIAFSQEQRFLPLVKYPKKDTIILVTRKADTIKQLDMQDVIGSVFGYKNNSKADTVTTRATFSVVPAIGYTLQSKLALTLAGNIAFRTENGAKISTITINTAYTQTKQIIIPIQSNIWTKNNGYDFLGDIRFLKYPQSTYGLGSNANIRNEDPMDYSFFRFSEIVLRRLSNNFYAGLGYVADIHWNITHKGPLDGAPSDYTAYGPQSHSLSSGITVNALFDSRDNSINPYKGFFMSVQYRDNPVALGNNSKWQSLVVDVRKYFNFPQDTNNVLAFWSYDWLVLSGNPPYLDLPATA